MLDIEPFFVFFFQDGDLVPENKNIIEIGCRYSIVLICCFLCSYIARILFKYLFQVFLKRKSQVCCLCSKMCFFPKIHVFIHFQVVLSQGRAI